MPDPDPVITPDEQPVFDALLAAGVDPSIAYTAVRRIRELAAHNITALIESKFDAVNARFDAVNANLDALKDHLKRERAMLWAVIALLGAAVVRYLVAG